MGKELFYRVLIGLISFLSVYLVGCFVKISFDITEWDEFTRGFVGIFGLLIGIILATCPLFDFKNK